MASIELSRDNAWEIDYDSRSKGANGEVRANGTQHGLWSFSLNGIRSAIGNRKIKVTGLTFLWETSAKFTYDTYIGTAFDSGVAYLVSAKGSGSYYVEIGNSTSAQSAMSVFENCINNTNNSLIYVTIHKSGSAGGNGYCRCGRLIVSYELAAPVVTEIIGDITKSADATIFGNSVSYSIQVYNTLQVNVTQVKLEFYRGTNTSVANTYTLSNISIEPGYSTTISSTVQFVSAPSGIGRSTPTYVKVTISRGSTTDSQSTSFVTLLDKLYSPTINVFNLGRCSDVSGSMRKDDSGEQMMTDIQIGLNSDTVENFTLKVYYEENGTASSSTATSIDLGLSNANIANFKIGYYNSTTLVTRSGNFDNASSWGFRAVLTDGYESAIVYYTISKSFANVHMAGLYTGGVALGMFSTASENNPKFESAYPAYFYNGISGCDYSTSEVKTPYRWINGKPIYRKVVQYSTAIGGSTSVDIPIGISATDFGTLVSINGHMVQKDSDTAWEIKPLNSTYPGGADGSALITYLYKTTSDIHAVVATGSAYSTYNIISVVIILEYTKATD